MTKNWAVIFNKQLELYVAISSESGLSFLRSEEYLIQIDLTKAQALQKANTMNEILDRAKELL